MTARAAIDLRLNVTAETEAEVWELVSEFVDRVREIAPANIIVRYYQLRPGHKSPTFPVTMAPRRRRL